MFKKAIPLAVAATLVVSMAGCSGQHRGGGGGGGMNAPQGQGQTKTEQVKSNLPGDNFSHQGKTYADAYSRVAWIHSNLAVRDWERALDDLHYVRDRVDDLLKDKNVPADSKTALKGLKADIAKLDTAIQKHDMASINQTKALMDRFATDLNRPMTMAWVGEHKGGGAGTVPHRTQPKAHPQNKMYK
jgi:hypothetical protein